MQIVKVTQIDDDKQESGVWTDYGDVKLLIARFPSDEASKVLNRIRKRKRNRELDVTSEEAQTAIRNLIANRVLIGWENVKGKEDGQLVNLPYTPDHCKKLLKIDPDLLDFVSDFSRDIDNYLQEDENITVGES